jgi:hypothetical protein
MHIALISTLMTPVRPTGTGGQLASTCCTATRTCTVCRSRRSRALLYPVQAPEPFGLVMIEAMTFSRGGEEQRA